MVAMVSQVAWPDIHLWVVQIKVQRYSDGKDPAFAGLSSLWSTTTLWAARPRFRQLSLQARHSQVLLAQCRMLQQEHQWAPGHRVACSCRGRLGVRWELPVSSGPAL